MEVQRVEERRHKSPVSRQTVPSENFKPKQTFVVQKRSGKENRPKGKQEFWNFFQTVCKDE